jgi:hypothetical protein
MKELAARADGEQVGKNVVLEMKRRSIGDG